MPYRNCLLISFLLLIAALSCQAQIFLQLERFDNPKSKKFQIGEDFEFRLHEYPKTWRKSEMIDLIPEKQLIVFEDTYYSIEEIKDIRLRYPTIKALGTRTMQFSAVWFVYGGVATLASEGYTMSEREIILGGSVALAGFLLRQFFSKKRVKLGKRKRLRVMDLRFKLDNGL